ncbi:MAG: hypothetical protein ABJA98_21160 [Acidobacteriota bacterium]
MTAREFAAALELSSIPTLRPWIKRLLVSHLVHSAGRTQGTRYSVDPDRGGHAKRARHVQFEVLPSVYGGDHISQRNDVDRPFGKLASHGVRQVGLDALSRRSQSLAFLDTEK